MEAARSQFARRVKRAMHAVMLLLMVASAALLLLRQSSSSPFDVLLHAAGTNVDNNKNLSRNPSSSETDVEWEFMPQIVEGTPPLESVQPGLEAEKQEEKVKSDEGTEVCDYTVGEWVLDETNQRPFYSGRECSRFLSPDWACRLRNHTNLLMDRYRWQPAGCDLPLFNASAALEMLRNKVVAFIGDSLGRQQYQSLLCMLTHGKNETPISSAASRFGFYTPLGSRRPTGWADTFLSTNTTILYKWSVSLSFFEPLKTNNSLNALHIDRLEPFLVDNLHNFDVLVFNSGHHWNQAKMDQRGFKFYSNGNPAPEVSIPEAYNRSMHNVVRWVDEQSWNTSTRVYYRSMSPKHFKNGDWNTGGTCDDARIGEELEGVMKRDVVAESALNGTSLRFLNVSALSAVRGESHVAKYRRYPGGQDCTHWCMPGVPDTWNEILLAELAVAT